MQFQFSQDVSIIGTSNITHFLDPDGLNILYNNDHILRPGMLESIFGLGHEDIDDPEEGYTDPEFYFKGPGGSLLGIGWRYGVIRLRGCSQSLVNQFIPPTDICKSFVRELVDHIEDVVHARSTHEV